MSIKSIKIKNLLSFDELIIDDFKDINCIVGRNNSGKSNLLKLIRFFYNKLEGKRELPPTLNSNYSTFGTITIVYDTSRIKQIVTSETNKGKSSFFKHIYNVLFKEYDIFSSLDKDKNSIYELTLQVNSDDSTKWSTKNKDILNIINYLYPFFDIETRHIDLYDWNKLWIIVSRLKSFNINKLKQDEIVEFFNDKLSSDGSGYKEYIEKIQHATQTNKYSYREKVLNYVKAGLKGQTFLIDEKSLEVQSDGTNSYRFIKIALELLISLTRRDYINPTIYIDEPEVGLHPKRNEELIYKLYDIYNTYKKTKETKEKGKYKTPYPNIIFATHSPNIVKEVIKLFEANQQILHFSKKQEDNTRVQKMKSTYEDSRFLNIFSDNEARLFFSNFILFVEGETELEIFGNKKLLEKFPKLKEIDIYKSSSNVLSSHINPAYSNTAIPYLSIFDADKLIDIDFSSKKLKFKKDILNLYQFNSKSYFDSRQRLIYDFLKLLPERQQFFLLEFDSKKLFINNINYTILMNYINESFAKKENYYFNNTTIEGVLINENSIFFFCKWLFNEFRMNLKNSYNSKTPPHTINKIKINKINKIKKYRRFIKNNFSKKEIITLFTLIFGGKTETSVATATKNYTELDAVFIGNLEKVKNNYIQDKKALNLGDLLGKTSGWTTKFLNFAIDEINNSLTATDKKEREEEFREKFEQNFGELYDIITSIETKL
ncbi:MAG: retron Eco8 family effector endonuclease [Sulfurovum sp.]|nr:retron Eco8 family effector endonuclease [Sulfurovum sp.]